MTMTQSEEQALVSKYNDISNLRGVADLTFHWGLIGLMFWWVHTTQSILVGLVALVVIASLQNGLASMAHEAFHFKVFKTKRLNSLAGSYLCSYPLGLPYETYRKRHLDHHRKVGQADDPDWGNYQGEQFESAAAVYRFYLGKLLGTYLVVNVLSTLSGNKPPVLETSSSADSSSDVVSLGMTQAVLFTLIAVLFDWWLYFLLWALPIITVTSFLISFRAWLEHNHSDENSEMGQRLFDYKPNALEHFMVSPCHFHLHAIHHAYPAVPHYRLKAMKREMADRGISYPCIDREGYLKAFREKVSALP